MLTDGRRVLALARQAAAAGTSYETDMSAWALEQAALLRNGSWAKLDIAHLADEIEALSRTERHALTSALRVILLHMLKWDHQPARRTRGWATSIRMHSLAVAERLEDSPSLASYFDDLMERAYRQARIKAGTETKLPETTFPQSCPYPFEAVMNRDVSWPPSSGEP